MSQLPIVDQVHEQIEAIQQIPQLTKAVVGIYLS